MSRDAISKYERDDIIPLFENAKMIAQALGVFVDYLVLEDDSLEVLDVDMLNRMLDIQRLAEDDKTTAIKIIDAFIRDTKTKRLMHKKTTSLEVVLHYFVKHMICGSYTVGGLSLV